MLTGCGTGQGLQLDGPGAGGTSSGLEGSAKELATNPAEVSHNIERVRLTKYPARHRLRARTTDRSRDNRDQLSKTPPASVKAAQDEVALPPKKRDVIDANRPMLTPKIGSPEWQVQQDREDKREKQLDRTIRGICNNC